MGLTLVTSPTDEPITLEQFKQHCRVEINDDDPLLIDLIAQAREKVEIDTGERQLMHAQYKLWLDSFTDPQHVYYDDVLGSWVILLPRPPLFAVVAVQYTDPGGTLTTLDPSKYQWDATRMFGRLLPAYGCVWPVTRVRTVNAVQITFTCGYSTPEEVPPGLKAAIKLLAAHWYLNREATDPVELRTVPLSYQALIENQHTGELVVGTWQRGGLPG